jgi:hypothetical protein
MSGYFLGKGKRTDLQPSNKGRFDVHTLGTFITVGTSVMKGRLADDPTLKVVRAGRIQGKGSIVSGVQTKLEPLLAHLTHLTIV